MEVLLAQFIQFLKVEKKYSEHTILAYQHDIESFAIFLEEEWGVFSLFTSVSNIQTLQLKHLRAWVGTLSSDYAKTSIHRKISAIKSFLKFSMKEGWLSKNPAKHLILPKKNKPLPIFVPETQMLQVMENISWNGDFNQVRNQLIFELLYGCGLRRSELCQIQYSRIDYSQMLISITGKGKKQRIVPFGEQVQKAMQAYEAICQEKGLYYKNTYILTEDGKPLYGLLVYRIVRESLSLHTQLKKNSPHILRHTFATHLLDHGADLFAVKELLGHSSLTSTQVYTHNSLSRLKTVHQLSHPKG